MAIEKLIEKPWLYTLSRLDDGTVVLSVLCGCAGMYELNIPLDIQDANRALVDQNFVDTFANDIRSHPGKYADRGIRLMDKRS